MASARASFAPLKKKLAQSTGTDIVASSGTPKKKAATKIPTSSKKAKDKSPFASAIERGTAPSPDSIDPENRTLTPYSDAAIAFVAAENRKLEPKNTVKFEEEEGKVSVPPTPKKRGRPAKAKTESSMTSTKRSKKGDPDIGGAFDSADNVDQAASNPAFAAAIDSSKNLQRNILDADDKADIRNRTHDDATVKQATEQRPKQQRAKSANVKQESLADTAETALALLTQRDAASASEPLAHHDGMYEDYAEQEAADDELFGKYSRQ